MFNVDLVNRMIAKVIRFFTFKEYTSLCCILMIFITINKYITGNYGLVFSLCFVAKLYFVLCVMLVLFVF